MKLDRTDVLIVNQLKDFPDSFGLDLVKRSHGKIRRTQVYVRLAFLEEEGLVHSRKETANVKGWSTPLQRRVYSLTDAGCLIATASPLLQPSEPLSDDEPTRDDP